MIPNLVTHVRRELDKGLKSFFSDRYIISVVLEDMEEDVKTSFINNYADVFNEKGERVSDGAGIPVLTNWPEDLKKPGTFVLVGLGSGKEDIGNIGMSGGGFDNDDSAIIKEVKRKVFRIDKTTLGVFIDNVPDISTVVIPNLTAKDITFSEDGYLVIKNISPKLLDTIDYDNDTLQVNYAPLLNKNKPGMGYGFVVEESASVLIVSNNLDDIRALDSIIKAIVILMRKKEFTKYNLGNFTVQAPLPLEDYAPGTPAILFGREFDLEYKVDYLLDSINRQTISKILIDLGDDK